MSHPAPAQAAAQTGKRTLPSVESTDDALTPESPRKRPCNAKGPNRRVWLGEYDSTNWNSRGVLNEFLQLRGGAGASLYTVKHLPEQEDPHLFELQYTCRGTSTSLSRPCLAHKGVFHRAGNNNARVRVTEYTLTLDVVCCDTQCAANKHPARFDLEELEETKAAWRRGQADYDDDRLLNLTAEDDDEGRGLAQEQGQHCPASSSSSSAGPAAPATVAGRGWFSRHLARNFLCKQRHHSNVGFNLTPMKKKDGLYIEYREDSAGSRRHPCPAYDGLTHDGNNAYIEPCPDFMHVSVLCKEEACKRLGPVLFKVQDHEEKLRGSRNPSTARGSNRKTNQEVAEGKETGQEEENDEESDDEETRAAEAAKAEKRDKRYRARLERLLAQLAPLPRPAELDYVGQDLPSGTLEKVCKQRELVLRESVKLFMKYWAREAAAERKFDSLQARGSGEELKEQGSFEEDSGEDSDSTSDKDHWKDIFRERYEHARKELVQRLTLFMNDYLCHIKGLSKEAIAVFWGQGQEKTWVLKPIDDFKYQGDDLEIKLPPSSIKLKSKTNKGRREPSGTVELDRGVMTTLRKAWLQSSRRRIAKSIDFFTNPREEALHNTRYSDRETDALNWFTGFRVSTQQVRNYMETNGLDDAAMHQLAAPFREYVHDILAGGVTQMSRYLFKWMNTLLRKGKKPEQACVFISEPGAGKTTLIELLSRVIGEQWVFVSSKPEEIMGKHNSHLSFRVLVVSEEATLDSTNKLGSNAMKEKIASKKLNINPKFMPLFAVRDPSGHIFNSNYQNTVLVEKGECRYIFYPVSNKFANRIRTTSANEYFARLRALPDEILAWQLFLSQDSQVDGIDLRQDAMYNTEVFWQSAFCSAPLHVQFFYETIKNSKPLDEVGSPSHWEPKHWHKKYNSWCTESRNGFFTAKNIVTFERDLKYYLQWDSQARRLLAGLSLEEQLMHIKARITGVYEVHSAEN